MGYLAWCHIHRMILDYGGYTLDITGYVYTWNFYHHTIVGDGDE
jgi:hypothetical protein